MFFHQMTQRVLHFPIRSFVAGYPGNDHDVIASFQLCFHTAVKLSRIRRVTWERTTLLPTFLLTETPRRFSAVPFLMIYITRRRLAKNLPLSQYIAKLKILFQGLCKKHGHPAPSPDLPKKIFSNDEQKATFCGLNLLLVSSKIMRTVLFCLFFFLQPALFCRLQFSFFSRSRVLCFSVFSWAEMSFSLYMHLLCPCRVLTPFLRALLLL